MRIRFGIIVYMINLIKFIALYVDLVYILS